MKILNFSTAEELIFYDKKLQELLPRMFVYFEQWRLSKRISYLKELGKQAILDFLNSLQDEELEILETYFQERIFLEKLNYNIVENLKIPLNETDVCQSLCNIEGFNYYNTWRDEHFIYISFWR